MTGRGRRAARPKNLATLQEQGTLVRAASNGAPAIVRKTPLGPELPDIRPDNGNDYQPQTRAIYESIRRSPVAGRYLPTDWLLIQNLMLLQDDYFTRMRGRAILAAELRQEYAQLGLTPAARAALKWDDEHNPMTEAGPQNAGRSGREAQERIDNRRDSFFLLMGEKHA